MIDKGTLTSVIFYGPPGTGKTTLAEVISTTLKMDFVRINATSASVKDIRAEADKATIGDESRVIFVDEIHRFSKTQQDVLLPFVENGHLILIGATTENPFHSVNSALVSRSQIFELKPLDKTAMAKVIIKVIKHLQENGQKIKIDVDAASYLIGTSANDARKLITSLELAFSMNSHLTLEVAKEAVPSKYMVFGEGYRYDLASAFQGSIQASDADSAIYWLAKWLESGEDPKFIARRLLVCAAEDAASNPLCTAVAHAAYAAASEIGRPECDIVMAQATIMIAQSHRSKIAANAIWQAVRDIRDGVDLEVPKAMRDNHYQGAKKLGNGGFQDGHDISKYVGVGRSYVKEDFYENKHET
jgi:putative ATPase